jgi:transposase
MMGMKSEKIGAFFIFHERNKRGQLIKTVFLNYVSVARFCPDNVNERKLAAIELVERKLCNQKIAGKICDFHHNTVYNLLRTKRLLGLEAVLKDNRGLKEPYKYIGEIRSHIKKLLRKYPDWTDESIADQATKDLDIKISRSAVARIRTEKQDNKSANKILRKNELMDMARVAEAIDEENFDARQLRLNFEKDPELKAKSEALAKEQPPKAKKETEKYLIKRLQEGERCNFSGGLIHHLFLQEIGFEDLLAPFPSNAGSTYSSWEILATLFHSVNFHIPSIEAFKLVNASELGVLIGKSRSPDKETIRDHLVQMANHNLADELIDRFAECLLQQGQIDPKVFFIDGHFLPYYGLKVIAKGYHTVRRLAMRGNELYAVTDLQGKPLFFMTESNEIDFRPIISLCAAKLVELGIPRPLLVFDRGGYGIHFFKELSETADFITWAKYISDKSLGRIPEESFSIGMFLGNRKYLVAEEFRTVTESIQTAKNEGRTNPISINLRLVVLKDVETGKRVGIYTNNINKPFHDIAYYMLQRWGDSENFFKEMMARFNLNYHPGYDIEELEKQPLVENPDIALTKKAVSILKKEVQGLGNDILLTEAKVMKRRDKRLVSKLSKLHKSLEEKKIDIMEFEKKMTTLPDKVSIMDLLKGRPMNRCDLEKKKLYDLMQFIAFHSRERLVDIFRHCYDDHRDIKKVLDMITSRAGYIKLIGQTLVVILDWIENKKHRVAAERFCHLLNQKGVKLVGQLKVKLFFRVSSIPHHGSKSAPSISTI